MTLHAAYNIQQANTNKTCNHTRDLVWSVPYFCLSNSFQFTRPDNPWPNTRIYTTSQHKQNTQTRQVRPVPHFRLLNHKFFPVSIWTAVNQIIYKILHTLIQQAQTPSTHFCLYAVSISILRVIEVWKGAEEASISSSITQTGSSGGPINILANKD